MVIFLSSILFHIGYGSYSLDANYGGLFYHEIGQRKLQKSKATLTSDATTQIIDVDEMEFVHTGGMGFEFNDYPGSGANNRHTPHTEGTR